MGNEERSVETMILGCLQKLCVGGDLWRRQNRGNCREEVFASGGGAEWRGEACLQRWRRLRRI